MNYEEARSLIDTGDMIAVKRKTGVFATIERLVQRSPYTHAGVAIWIEGGLWMAELNSGGNHLVPLSQLADLDFDVYAAPVNDLGAVRDAILTELREALPYGYLALVVVGLLNLLRIKAFLHMRHVVVCSGYVVRIWEAAGWPETSRQVSPAELASVLKMKFSVTASAAPALRAA